jgi:hypothetical protein
MSRLSSSDKETPEQKAANSNDTVEHCNGVPGESEKTEVKDATGAQGSSTNESQEPSSLDRVEELMDQLGKKVGSFTSMLGQHLFRLAAHAREAAEDCWAEAQSIRRGEPQSEQDQEEQPKTPPAS